MKLGLHHAVAGVVFALAGCVADQPVAQAGRAITVDGVAMTVRQVDRGMTYGFMADADGNYAMRESGLGQFIAVAGAPDYQMAIRAFAAFCGRVADLTAWDTDQTAIAPDTGEYQFGGTCG